MQKRLERLERFDKKYSTEEVLSLVPDDITKIKGEKKRKMFDGHLIKFKSLRLLTFKRKGIVCLNCGIKGKFFVKERLKQKFNENEPYHLNLYAINESGEEILMTKDHIISIFNKGETHIDNMQTLCTVCNYLKDARC